MRSKDSIRIDFIFRSDLITITFGCKKHFEWKENSEEGNKLENFFIQSIV